MLILTRKKNQSIMIGDDIEIMISGIEEGKVKLGIKAPKNIEIHRKEIYEDIQQENKIAANTSKLDIKSLKNVFNKKL